MGLLFSWNLIQIKIDWSINYIFYCFVSPTVFAFSLCNFPIVRLQAPALIILLNLKLFKPVPRLKIVKIVTVLFKNTCKEFRHYYSDDETRILFTFSFNADPLKIRFICINKAPRPFIPEASTKAAVKTVRWESLQSKITDVTLSLQLSTREPQLTRTAKAHTIYTFESFMCTSYYRGRQQAGNIENTGE